MKSFGRVLLPALGCGLVFAVSGCATSTVATQSSPAVSAPVTPASAPASTPSGSAPTASVPIVLATPEAAAKHLYDAWQAGDTTAAAKGASPDAVAALFAKAWKAGTYDFGGCSGTTECDYNFATGAIRMTIDGDSTTGYTVTTVQFGSAG